MMDVVKRGPHPSGAPHLELVLCRWGRQWVVCTWNKHTQGTENGLYFEASRDGKRAARGLFEMRVGTARKWARL